MTSQVPAQRIRPCNQAPVRAEGAYVVYWRIANRRIRYNYSLQRAIEWSRELGKPLVILDALRCDYPWASERLHSFLLASIRDTAGALDGLPVTHYPYVEQREGDGRGLLEALAASSMTGAGAAVVVTDDYPAFMMPHMIAAAAHRLAVRLECVDSNGILPMRDTERVYSRAHDFRRYMHATLVEQLGQMPASNPLAGLDLVRLKRLPPAITARWTVATSELLAAPAHILAALPIDHGVLAVAGTPGGEAAAGARLRAFLDTRPASYHAQRNDPSEETTSGLSPYLHFGNISAHEIVEAIIAREGWTPDRIDPKKRGQRAGWWGMSPEAESFLDQLVTWREVGFNMCALHPGYDRYESLPVWALQTLGAHDTDPREHRYTLEEFEAGLTHDPLWNAAQQQLVQCGTIHNYLRMLWGKKILHWSASSSEALEIMLELNNKYALDGRDPNSYSGIFWVLGRYDRAWGPERAVFGKVRYMSSESTARKYRTADYVRRYTPG
ncbi:MAG: deoxyribodipyrimidine photolyase [Bradymonadaceae bacterium]|nr:deoxyribodipyrimidine photolyase [Lujinxingiaceae bacterium]